MRKSNLSNRIPITHISYPQEEFFRLPRLELLLNRIPGRKDVIIRKGDVAKMIINPRQLCTDRFSLQVEDNRMRDDGICKGDYVVIQKQNHYHDGEIVAAQIGNRILIRRYFEKSSSVRLECPPPSKQTLIIDKSTPGFTILGSVVQVIREI